jgi:cyclopropane-fatty-acyl-phospholipid synthase
MLRRYLERVVRHGRLRVILDGRPPFEVGETASSKAPTITVRLRGRLTPLSLWLNPELALGEAYQSGRLTVEDATLPEFLDLVGRNLAGRPTGPFQALVSRLSAGRARNDRRAARRNVAHHYDLPESFYRTFLDQDMQYSCAYFRTGAETLEEAQAAKKRHIAAKLALGRDDRVLDIGCGWGGMALYLAQTQPGVRIDGVTLSREQFEAARDRGAHAGLADRVRFDLRDYRDLRGAYDRIVSVGMFEHVGPEHYGEFFASVRKLLAPGGVALIHTIGRRKGGAVNPWIAKHVFPGGYVPSLAEIAEAASGAGLWITDVEVLRLHYAETLRLWRERFMARRDELAQAYDEVFLRTWEFYLAGCEMNFRRGNLAVFQVQLAADIDAVPIARDYMFAEEQRLAPVRRRSFTVVGSAPAGSV